MALSFASANTFNLGAGTPLSVTFTNSAPCVGVAVITTFGAGGQCTVSSVTDSAGNTWTRRSQTQKSGSFSSGGGIDAINLEVWWANIPAIHTSAVTLTINLANTAAQGTGSFLILNMVTGSLTPAAPWDDTTIGTQVFENSSGSQTPTVPWHTTQSNSAVFAVISEVEPSGVAQTSSANLFGTQTSGRSGNTYHFGTAEVWSNPANPSSGNVGWFGTQSFYVTFADALSGSATGTASPAVGGGATGTTGTIKTDLTKISQSASGNVSASRSGTITTKLTRPNQSASAKETFTGAALTSLSRVSQSSSGNVSGGPHGTITTSLPKVSQSSSGNVSGGPHGTITTSLSKISQLAQAPGNTTGAITTTLKKAAQAVNARETFSGVIVTNLDSTNHLSIGIIANETFTGQIVMRLSRANFAAAGEERFIGYAVTRLGTVTGQTVANVVQAEVIILGPIVMNLSPLRSLLLGAKLGSPGAGKWYSWRYTDG